MKDLFGSPNLGAIYGNWEKTYGLVYEIPSSLGSTILVLHDAKAITDLFSKDTTTYHQIRLAKIIFRSIMTVSTFDGSCEAILSRSIRWQAGDALLVMEGETHKRLVRGIYLPVMSAEVY